MSNGSSSPGHTKNLVALEYTSKSGEFYKIDLNGRSYRTMRSSILNREYRYQYFLGYAFDKPQHNLDSDYRMRNAISGEILHAANDLQEKIFGTNGLPQNNGTGYNENRAYTLEYKLSQDLKEQISKFQKRECALYNAIIQQVNKQLKDQNLSNLFNPLKESTYRNMAVQRKIDLWDDLLIPFVNETEKVKKPRKKMTEEDKKKEEENIHRNDSVDANTVLYYILQSRELYNYLKSRRGIRRMTRRGYALGNHEVVKLNTEAIKDVERLMVSKFKGDEKDKGSFINLFVEALENAGYMQYRNEKNEDVKKARRNDRVTAIISSYKASTKKINTSNEYEKWKQVIKDWGANIVKELSKEEGFNARVDVKNEESAFLTIQLPGEGQINYAFDKFVQAITDFMNKRISMENFNDEDLEDLTDKEKKKVKETDERRFKSSLTLHVVSKAKFKLVTFSPGQFEAAQILFVNNVDNSKPTVTENMARFIAGHDKINSNALITNTLSELAQYFNSRAHINGKILLLTGSEQQKYKPYRQNWTLSIDEANKEIEAMYATQPNDPQEIIDAKKAQIKAIQERIKKKRDDIEAGGEFSSGEYFSDMIIEGFDGILDGKDLGMNIKYYITSLREFTLAKPQVSGLTMDSSQIRRYLSSKEITLLRFFQANNALISRVRGISDFAGFRDIPSYTEAADVLMKHNLGSFLRITSAEQDVVNYIIAANGHYIPASCIYQFALKRMVGYDENRKKYNYQPFTIVDPGPADYLEQVEYDKDLEEIGIDEETGKRKATVKYFDFRNLMVDNIIAEEQSLRIKFNEFKVVISDLLKLGKVR